MTNSSWRLLLFVCFVFMFNVDAFELGIGQKTERISGNFLNFNFFYLKMMNNNLRCFLCLFWMGSNLTCQAIKKFTPSKFVHIMKLHASKTNYVYTLIFKFHVNMSSVPHFSLMLVTPNIYYTVILFNKTIYEIVSISIYFMTFKPFDMFRF